MRDRSGLDERKCDWDLVIPLLVLDDVAFAGADLSFFFFFFFFSSSVVSCLVDMMHRGHPRVPLWQVGRTIKNVVTFRRID